MTLMTTMTLHLLHKHALATEFRYGKKSVATLLRVSYGFAMNIFSYDLATDFPLQKNFIAKSVANFCYENICYDLATIFHCKNHA
ncbi:hypothetical protein HanXRQr2_Chr12g0524251 [Helianthus annuus]|uniref:Uncharacterized protein n=1 Tax=Helianthus annuus TaxID=4232 RepID=A0A9K3EN28_HELAN|nr:hypothetical protein HanXRQr2_Chr12g0524251 [Helianthus annuus]KAJ0861307.1 hypothetical protein HanPSC8_Chr12g0505211 [Helianthus annuus]